MKYSKLPRIYFPGKIEKYQNVFLSIEDTNYIKNVLRLRNNDDIRIFNQENGEYFGKIILHKKEVEVSVGELFRGREEESGDITIFMSIIKQDKFELVCDMATQIGIDKIIPLVTERSQKKQINTERLEKIILSSVKQSERMTIPRLAHPETIEEINSKNYEILFFANEMESSNEIVNIRKSDYKKIGIIIGPEGGFTEEEIEKLKSIENIKSVSLGDNVLRAETAAIVMLSKVGI